MTQTTKIRILGFVVVIALVIFTYISSFGYYLLFSAFIGAMCVSLYYGVFIFRYGALLSGEYKQINIKGLVGRILNIAIIIASYYIFTKYLIINFNLQTFLISLIPGFLIGHIIFKAFYKKTI